MEISNFKNFNKRKSLSKIYFDFLGNLFFAICIIVALALILFSSVSVECEVFGSSMQPNLNNSTNHDIVYINTRDFDFAYEDIVVIKLENENIIKRIVGLSGDRIDIVLSDGEYKLKRNGQVIDEKYIKISNDVNIPAINRNGMNETFDKFQELKINHSELFENGELIVPEHSIIALGDNRKVSLDSSFYGAFDYQKIEGKVELIRYAGTSEFQFYWDYIVKGEFFKTFVNIF